MIEDEWKDWLSESVFKSKYTISSYKNAHRRLTDNLGVAIKDATQDAIIKAVNEIANNPNTKAALLNCGIVFYNMAKKDNKKLLKEKQVITEEIAKHRAERASIKTETLPTKEELERRLKKLYNEQKWSDFIILWLMINYNTRQNRS